MEKPDCQRYGCAKQGVDVVDMWVFCKEHAEEYKKKFAAALLEREVKRQTK